MNFDKEIDAENAKARSFWAMLKYSWPVYHKMILSPENYPSQDARPHVLMRINDNLHRIFPRLDISYTFGEMNSNYNKAFKNVIELYISPCMNKDTIDEMKVLYNNRPKDMDVVVSCFKYYRTREPVTKIIVSANPDKPQAQILLTKEVMEKKGGNIKIADADNSYQLFYDEDDSESTGLVSESTDAVTLEDFGVQTEQGMDSAGRHIIHLIIAVKKRLRHMLYQVPVKFKGGKTTERPVWRFRNAAFDIMLEALLGEENLMLYVGYIEILPEEGIPNNSEFVDLLDLKPAVEALRQLNNVRECQICRHSSNQCQIFQCSRCKKAYYCGRICQAEDRASHKSVCGGAEQKRGDIASSE